MSERRLAILESRKHFVLQPLGLDIVGDPTVAQCKACARALVEIGSAAAWGLADLLIHSEARHGDRYTDVMDATGRKYGTLRNLVYVGTRFDDADHLSRRRDKLYFGHHQAVAMLSRADAAALLDRAEAEGLSREDLRALVRERRYLERTAERDWPAGKYGLIYADPPWQPDAGVLDPTRAIENQYPTMPLEAICALPVGDLAADDCVLLTWVTSQKITEYAQILAAWGFEHKTGAVWVKDLLGMGHWFRQRHELLMLATRGRPATPREAARPDSVIQAPRRGHSQKPDEAYALIEAMFPGVPKVELFARRPREGWDAWGDDVALGAA